MIVDECLVPLFDKVGARAPIERVIVVEDSYEGLLASADPAAWHDPKLAETEARRVLHERDHRQAEGRGLLAPLERAAQLGVAAATHGPRNLRGRHDAAGRADVPRECVGHPYLAAMVGAKLVFPGPHLDPERLLEGSSREVTSTAGVPTIWLGILQALDAKPGRWELSKMKGMLVGGSAAPGALIAGFDQRDGRLVVHGWGMTETSPVASTAHLPGDLRATDEATRYDCVAKQGIPLPFVECAPTSATGDAVGRRDGASSRCAARGSRRATTTRRSRPAMDRRWLVPHRRHRAIDEQGFIRFVDRSKDVIKSGGEWISSVTSRTR